jgi:hypothetical protein
MNPRRWLHEHSLKLLAIRDTPEAIAGGVAIGIFMGFTPLIGLKTGLTIVLAWLTRSNIIAAVIAQAAHDVAFFLMPILYIWEYSVGYWLLSHPHQWPTTLPTITWEGISLRNWIGFLCGVGKPLLVGGLVCPAPLVPIFFFLTRSLVARHHRKRHHHDSPEKVTSEPTAQKNRRE